MLLQNPTLKTAGKADCVIVATYHSHCDKASFWFDLPLYFERILDHVILELPNHDTLPF